MTQIDALDSSNENSRTARFMWIPGLAILIKAALFAAAYFAVWLYSVLVHPGEMNSFYEQKAQVISPVVAIGIGFPLIFLAGRFLVRRFGMGSLRPAVSLWLFWVVLDLPVLFMINELSSYLICLLGWSFMAIASYLGGKRALA